MMRAIKQLLRDAARKRGYLLAKYPTVTFSPVSVFNLAVHLLMAAKGPGRTFVQVGANDGRHVDPLSQFVMRFPWRGILIEPQPDVFGRLCNNYAGVRDRLILENLAISKNLEELILYRARKDAPVEQTSASAVVSTNPQLVSAQLNIPPSQLEPIKVPCLRLDAVLDKHGWKSLDVLVVDTEGNDLDVLESLDLRRFKPLIVQFEHGHLPPAKLNAAVEYLTAGQYRILYGGYQIDSVAVHEDFWYLIEGSTSQAMAHAAA